MTQDPGVHGTDGVPADGTPPAAPNHGAPGYGSPAPEYGNPPAAPGYPAPGYGTPAPGYGTPQPGYDAPQQPAYGAPQQPGYGAPQQPAYGAPQQPPGYGAPQQPAYGAPQQPGYPSPPPNYGPPAGHGAPSGAAVPLNPAEEKQYSMFAHLGGILGWAGWIPSLIIYLLYKDRGPFVKDQATTALNFQITAVIGFFAVSVLDAMLPLPLFLLNFVLYIAVVVFSVIGGVAANKGQAYRYPFSLSLVK
jgi:uncharacterized Tic20 family protein